MHIYSVHDRSEVTLMECGGYRKDIERARSQWQTFLSAAPAYPVGMFEGRGVVILAGRLQYMVPAWINVHMLRRTGERALAGCC